VPDPDQTRSGLAARPARRCCAAAAPIAGSEIAALLQWLRWARNPPSCVRQVQQIGHGDGAGWVQVNGKIPLFDRIGPSLRPDLTPGRAPRTAAVKDADAKAAAPAQPARSVLDRASTVLG